MFVNCLKTAICVGALALSPTPVLPQILALPAESLPEPLKAKEAPFIVELRFTGLRRIAPAAVAAQIASHPGDRFDASMIDKDVRALARLGWFESIRVESASSTAPFPQSTESSKRVTLIFHVHELPFPSKVEYSGSSGASSDRLRDSRRAE
jgi:outer membrane protein assembly factor BamA